jgi:hypothetical protein
MITVMKSVAGSIVVIQLVLFSLLLVALGVHKEDGALKLVAGTSPIKTHATPLKEKDVLGTAGISAGIVVVGT